MPYIKVKLNTIHDAARDISQISGKIGGIESSFGQAYRKIDWEVKNKANVSSKVQRISGKLDAQEQALRAMSFFLDNAYQKYADLAHIKPEEDKQSKNVREILDEKTKSLRENFLNRITQAANEWVKKNVGQVESWMEHLKEEQRNFIDRWAKVFDLSDYDYAQKLVLITELLNNPIECTALSVRWLLYRGSREGWFDQFFDIVDFERDKDGIFHVNVDDYDSNIVKDFLKDKDGYCWQQIGGYTELYDTIFNAFCDMEAKNDIRFVTDSGEVYTLWMWKGEYLNLGAGGEMGIYRGEGEVLSCATDSELKFKLHVDYGDGSSSDWEDETWWVTSFNPYKQDYKAADLTLTYEIDFSNVNPEIWNAFYRSYRDSKDIKFNADKKTAVIVF